MTTGLFLKSKTYKNICRGCLKMDDLFCIDDVQWEDVSLKKVLSNWISFEKNYEHKMPQNICKSCIKWVYNIQYFFTQIQRSEKILQNSLIHELSHCLMNLQDNINEPIVTLEVKNEILEFIDSQDNVINSNSNSSIDLNMPSSDQDTITSKSSINYVNIVPPMITSVPQIQIPSETKKDEIKMYIKEINNDKSEIQTYRKKLTEKQKLFNMQMEWKLLEQQGKVKSQFHKDFIYFCGACESGYNTYEELMMHKKIASHYKGGCIYVCPYCKFKKKSHSGFKDHLRIHRNEKPHVCATCRKGFTAKGCLSRHIRNVHLNQKRKKCKFCYKLFSNLEVLKEHEKAHENICYVCSFCGKSFKVHATWYRHERNHRKDKLRKSGESQFRNHQHTQSAFQCSKCENIYKSKIDLDEHMNEYHGTQFACDICRKNFSSEFKMKKHKDFVHSEGKYTCEICGYTVKQKYSLLRHIKKVHEGEKITHNCEYCEKVFSSKKGYRQHLRIHTNDTTYQCKVCLRICTNKRNLDIHMRTHTGERSHCCVLCGKKFASKENFNYHMEQHTTAPSHHCSLCPRAFYRNYILQRHIRRIHSQAGTSKQIWI